jgi:hypothetical protein
MQISVKVIVLTHLGQMPSMWNKWCSLEMTRLIKMALHHCKAMISTVFGLYGVGLNVR